jgi:CheY-like chemotaxis protein
MKLVFEAEGYPVDLAGDGVEAWQQMQRGPQPELIILDWMMPRMDGEQFLKRLRTSPHAEIPVIALSGNEAIRQKESLLENGCYLKKPVELEVLLKTVTRFLPRSSKRDVA